MCLYLALKSRCSDNHEPHVLPPGHHLPSSSCYSSLPNIPTEMYPSAEKNNFQVLLGFRNLNFSFQYSSVKCDAAAGLQLKRAKRRYHFIFVYLEILSSQNLDFNLKLKSIQFRGPSDQKRPAFQ